MSQPLTPAQRRRSAIFNGLVGTIIIAIVIILAATLPSRTPKDAEPIATQDTTFAFAGVPWGSSAAEVDEILTAKGWEWFEPDERTTIEGVTTIGYRGHIETEEAALLAVLTDSKGLIEIALLIGAGDDPQWSRQKNVYMDFKAIFQSKYGDGNSHELFERPYADGDGEELQAFRLNKAAYTTDWERGESSLHLEIGTELAVIIAYANFVWSSEGGRLKKKADDDF